MFLCTKCLTDVKNPDIYKGCKCGSKLFQYVIGEMPTDISIRRLIVEKACSVM